MAIVLGTKSEIITAVAAHASADHGLAVVPNSLLAQVRERILIAA